MDKAIRKSVTIPPYWANMLFGLFVFVVGIAFRSADLSYEVGPTRITRMIIMMGVVLFIEACFHWTISPKGIVIRFLWIPFRLIRWEKVSTAEYIYRWFMGGPGNDRKGQGIFITLHRCPCFSPEIDALDVFNFKHPFTSLFIRFTPRHQKRYVELFRQYYPELSFQLGYEGDLKKDG